MKNIFFFVGLPRAGNTLLASLVNQSKNLTITANSITPSILYTVHQLKQDTIYQNFPDSKSVDNVLKNVLPSYYNHWKADNILDRGPWATPANLDIVNQIQDNPKFVVLYRPVQECVASFIKLKKPQNLEEYVKHILTSDHILGKNIWSINNLIEHKIPFHLMTYDNLITKTEKTIKSLFNFLDLKMPKINFNKLDQLSINGIVYHDDKAIKNLHKIRTDKIKKIKYNINEYLSDEIIELCKQYEPRTLHK